MKKSEIHKILVKFLNREANIQELEQLDSWLKKSENIPIFNHFVKIHYLTACHMAEYDVNKAKKSIEHRLNLNKRQRRLATVRKMAIAASVLALLGFSFFTWFDTGQAFEVPKTTPKVLEAGSNKAVLTLEDGNQVALEKGKDYRTQKVNSNGEELIYHTDNENGDIEKELLYNYLTIPRGGQFFLQLADGTRVWLNSDSKLKYPVKFRKGKVREVELAYGEAYFEVSPSTDHQGAGFVVHSKFQKVDVLGTKFNIKAYDGESAIATTLVEGKVNVQKGSVHKVLKPNQQARIGFENDSISVLEVDVSEEISWVDGLFTFNEMPLDDMMRILSRWYDAEVFFESTDQKGFVFTGVLERTKSVEEILELIEATSEGQVSFKVNGKAIIIK